MENGEKKIEKIGEKRASSLQTFDTRPAHQTSMLRHHS